MGQAIEVRQSGQVVRFIEERGFGFIRPDSGGEDLFFHVYATEGDPVVGARVQFDVSHNPSDGRTRAVNVVVGR